MAILKQSTTYTRMFLMVASSDHITGLTGATPSVNLSKNGGAFATSGVATTEVANGWYSVALTTGNTATNGDLAYHITAASADPTDFVDQVQTNIFTDLLLDANGNVAITSSFKKNTAATLPFVMTTGNPPIATAGLLPITAQRSLGGAGFGACANAVTEIGNGCYTINLAATDTNASVVLYRFTASSANDQVIVLYTQP